jgi:hypothetical protein
MYDQIVDNIELVTRETVLRRLNRSYGFWAQSRLNLSVLPFAATDYD